MQIVDDSILEFPVFEYSVRGCWYYSICEKDFGNTSRLGLKGLKKEGLEVFDSKGRHFEFVEIKEKKMRFPSPLALIGWNLKYTIKMSLILKANLDIPAFKEQILKVLQSNRYSLESSGDPDEIMADVKKANSYREIIEMFL